MRELSDDRFCLLGREGFRAKRQEPQVQVLQRSRRRLDQAAHLHDAVEDVSGVVDVRPRRRHCAELAPELVQQRTLEIEKVAGDVAAARVYRTVPPLVQPVDELHGLVAQAVAELRAAGVAIAAKPLLLDPLGDEPPVLQLPKVALERLLGKRVGRLAADGAHDVLV